MPLDVARNRERGLAGAESTQMAGRSLRLLALLRSESGASGTRDVDQSELPSIRGRRASQKFSRLGTAAGTPVSSVEALVFDTRARRGGLAGAAAARPGERAMVRSGGARGGQLERFGAGSVTDRLRAARTAGDPRRSAGPAHAGVGGSHQPIRRGLSDAGYTRRPLDGASIHRRGRNRT